MPTAPSLNEQEYQPVPADRPKSVDNAFLLWLIGAGISLLGVIFVLTVGVDAITDSARESLKNSGRPYTEEDVKNFANLSKIIGVVIGLLFVGLFVLFAYKMRAGRNWARILLTVLGGLSLVFTLLGISSTDGLTLVVRLIEAVLTLVAIYFMFRPEANRYFAAGRARR
ncbi:MAG: hypothetical protein ACJ72N_02845 [Labedaea sp.]